MSAKVVAVLGAAGQLGTDVVAAFGAAGWTLVALDQADLDLTRADAAALERAVSAQGSPAAIVNCAAYTNVDKAETERELAFRVNADAVRPMAQAAERLGALLVQISTDYVFDGAKGAPYVETDTPHPVQVYGESKLAGEKLAARAPRHAVVRTCGLYGAQPCIGKAGANFIRKILRKARETGRLEVVDDEIVSPTFTVDLANQLVALTDAGTTGIVHAVNTGPVSWFEFAKAALEITGTTAQVTPTSAARFKAPARRPPFSALANARLTALGLNRMPSWRDGLSRYLHLTGGPD